MVIGTANHCFVDAVAGSAVMGVGLLMAPRMMRQTDRVKARFPSTLVMVFRGKAQERQVAGCERSVGDRLPGQRRDEPRGFIDV